MSSGAKSCNINEMFRIFTLPGKYTMILASDDTTINEETDEGGLTDMNDNTIKFVVPDEADQEMKALLTTVYSALSEKGYNPINQIVGYLLSEDPTYITNYKSARSLICKVDRDELLQELVRHYLFD